MVKNGRAGLKEEVKGKRRGTQMFKKKPGRGLGNGSEKGFGSGERRRTMTKREARTRGGGQEAKGPARSGKNSLFSSCKTGAKGQDEKKLRRRSVGEKTAH